MKSETEDVFSSDRQEVDADVIDVVAIVVCADTVISVVSCVTCLCGLVGGAVENY